MKQAALEYANAGWRVIPVFGIHEGRCACGNPYCTAPGKHPLITTGTKLSNASADPRVVSDWWDQWPNANIAVAMGTAGSYMIAIDLDVHDELDGYMEFRQYLDSYGIPLGEPRRQQTGSGGLHMVYRLPPECGPVKNLTGWLPGVDVRADGGYILVAPSLHVTNGRYQWLDGAGPGLIPPELLTVLRAAKGTPGGGGGTPDAPSYDYRAAVATGPPRGARDHFFNARSFELRKADVPYEDAVKELRRHWELTEQSPGDEWPWPSAKAKLDRVYREVEPDPLPDWDPFAAKAAQSGRAAAAIAGAPEGKQTDVGNSERFAAWHHDDACYTQQQGWLTWDGTRWATDEMEQSIELAKATVRRMFAEAALEPDPVARDTLIKWAQASESRPRIEAMVRLARTDPRVARSVLEFDRDPWLFNTPSGTLDLRTGQLGEHRREDGLTRLSPVRYVPGARSQMFQDYLDSVTLGDTDLQAYLQRAAGYTLTASTREEVFFMIYGPKGSGKSTFVDGLLTIVGDMGMLTQADTLTHMRGAQAPKDELAAMLAKRLVATVEIQEGERFAESLVKQMTGGDRIAARQLYKTRFEFQPTFKLWIATNHAPRAYDDALWRRIKRVPFPYEVPKVQQNPRIKEALKDPHSEEAEAFLTWAVEGCLEWQRVGLGTAKVVEDDTEDYREEQDKFGRFLEEACHLGPDQESSSRDLYAAYVRWADMDGEKPMTATAFGIKLKDRGFIKNAKVRPVAWKGLSPIAVNTYGL